MKQLLIIPIKIYQRFYPVKLRGVCLFKESCSNHVLKVTNDNGLLKGIKSLIYRYKNCRPNYKIIELKNSVILVTSEHNVHDASEIDNRIIANKIQSYEQQLKKSFS